MTDEEVREMYGYGYIVEELAQKLVTCGLHRA
jgi:hypothetical protein